MELEESHSGRRPGRSSRITLLLPARHLELQLFSILVIGKNVAVPACESPQRFPSQRRRFGGHGKASGRRREGEGGKGGGEEAEREGEREYHSFIVVCFPTINDSGRGAEQLNIQTAQ